MISHQRIVMCSLSLVLAAALGCGSSQPEVKTPSYLQTNSDGSIKELTEEERQKLIDEAKERTKKRESEREG